MKQETAANLSFIEPMQALRVKDQPAGARCAVSPRMFWQVCYQHHPRARRMLREFCLEEYSKAILRGVGHAGSESREAFSRADQVAKVFGGDVRALHMLFAMLEIQNNNIDTILEESKCPAVDLRSFVLRQLLKAKWVVTGAKERRGTEFLLFGQN